MKLDFGFLALNSEYAFLAGNQTPRSCRLIVPGFEPGLAAINKAPSGSILPTNQDSPSMRALELCACLFGCAGAVAPVFFSEPRNMETPSPTDGEDLSCTVDFRSDKQEASLGPWAQRRLRLRQCSHARRVCLRLNGSPSESFATKVKVFSWSAISGTTSDPGMYS
jgi:hypothetical protein